MMFAKSLKQFVRTPITAAVFLALLAITALLVSGGAAIWARYQAEIKAYEGVFVTVGTVRQLPTHIEVTETWDAFRGGYTRRNRESFSAAIPPSVLDFNSANYIHEPENRPYYGAWRPDLKLFLSREESGWLYTTYGVVEVSPLEDCVPDSPVEVRIERILSTERVLSEVTMYGQGDMQQGDTILFCDHYNDSPQPLYADRTYLMVLRSKGAHNPQSFSSSSEYDPMTLAFSTQHRADGTSVETDITYRSILEVTDAVHETGEMRIWLEYAANLNNAMYTIPVLPTNATHLLMPFYHNTAYIVDGEDISKREYEDGDRVCLISEKFAAANGISVGDALRLPLYFADYQNAPMQNNFLEPYMLSERSAILFKWHTPPPLNAAGEPYRVFSDHEYTVKGIYARADSGNEELELGANTVVIPAASVRESDADNIAAHGPMKHTTTTFEIRSGSIETFMENWAKTGSSDLEFEFHDRGYTALQRGLENMRRVSLLLLAVGAAMALALAFYFCYVFISRNKMRTAIERMLGYTKRQCAVSVLSGFLLTAVIAIAIGSAAAMFAEGFVLELAAGQEYYDTMYTVGTLGQDAEEIEITANPALSSIAAGLGLLAATALISAAFTRANLKKEPLLLLGAKNE